MAVYVFPKLPSRYDIGIRLSGSGLANCLFVFSRGIIVSSKYNLPIINPTWAQFNIGPYLRKEKDKRHYFNLFKKTGISGIKKYFLLKMLPSVSEEFMANHLKNNPAKSGVIYVQGLKNFYEDLIDHHAFVKDTILDTINTTYLAPLNQEDFNCIGVHVRLGDYIPELRISILWYKAIIEKISSVNGNTTKVLLFSDGSEQDLEPLLKMPNVRRAFFGSSIADIIALSRCRVIVASDSTFSGWSSFLGQVPTIYFRKHFGRVLKNPEYEFFLKEEDSLPPLLENYLKKTWS